MTTTPEFDHEAYEAQREASRSASRRTVLAATRGTDLGFYLPVKGNNLRLTYDQLAALIEHVRGEA